MTYPPHAFTVTAVVTSANENAILYCSGFISDALLLSPIAPKVQNQMASDFS